ncbi:hypothetical protein COBT_004132, partial [Conglomerata obtusa]
KLQKLCNFEQDKWEVYLEKATFATNISFHRALQTSPYIFKHGKTPELPLDAYQNVKQIEFEREKLIHRRNLHFKKYGKIDIEKGKITNKNVFNVGDDVLVYKTAKTNKIQSYWEEGYKIADKLSDDAYLVIINSKFTRVNKNHPQKVFSKPPEGCRTDKNDT